MLTWESRQAVAQERGKVAGQHLDFERKKWRQEFDLQIRRTREHVEAECLKSQVSILIIGTLLSVLDTCLWNWRSETQNDCQRNLEACNSIKTDLRYSKKNWSVPTWLCIIDAATCKWHIWELNICEILSDKCEIQLETLRRELLSSSSSPPSGIGAVEAAQVATEVR